MALRLIFLFMYMFLYIYIYTHSACRGQKKVMNPLELKLQVGLNHPAWVKET